MKKSRVVGEDVMENLDYWLWWIAPGAPVPSLNVFNLVISSSAAGYISTPHSTFVSAIWLALASKIKWRCRESIASVDLDRLWCVVSLPSLGEQASAGLPVPWEGWEMWSRATRLNYSSYVEPRLKESESEVSQSCPTLCNPMVWSLLGSSVHGIFQARVLEGVGISFSRGSSWSRDWAWVSCIIGSCFTIWGSKEPRLLTS